MLAHTIVDDKRLRVRVNRERCQGHARCLAWRLSFFELDQFGHGREIGAGAVSAQLENTRTARAS